jgi:hypothetical protein
MRLRRGATAAPTGSLRSVPSPSSTDVSSAARRSPTPRPVFGSQPCCRSASTTSRIFCCRSSGKLGNSSLSRRLRRRDMTTWRRERIAPVSRNAIKEPAASADTCLGDAAFAIRLAYRSPHEKRGSRGRQGCGSHATSPASPSAEVSRYLRGALSRKKSRHRREQPRREGRSRLRTETRRRRFRRSTGRRPATAR